jgi:hypothetical protein
MPQSPPAAIRASLGVTFGFAPGTGPVRRVWYDLSHSCRAGPPKNPSETPRFITRGPCESI